MLRSCYEADVRFYANVPDTCRVRWYFVPLGTPFVPHLNNWLSGNWDSDPKPVCDLGEQPLTQAWANGLPPRLWRGDEPCGTEDQWRNGEPLPPETPVEVGPDGTPVCCDIPPLLDICERCATVTFAGIGPPGPDGGGEMNREFHLCFDEESGFFISVETITVNGQDGVTVFLADAAGGFWTLSLADGDEGDPMYSIFPASLEWDEATPLVLPLVNTHGLTGLPPTITIFPGNCGEAERPWEIHTKQLVQVDDARWVQVDT